MRANLNAPRAGQAEKMAPIGTKGQLDHREELCLVGRSITRDLELLAMLEEHHEVSRFEEIEQAMAGLAAGRYSVLVLEAIGPTLGVLGMIPALRRVAPDARIVLVHETLSQDRLAQAFSQGVVDTFSTPYRTRLLAERIATLATSK